MKPRPFWYIFFVLFSISVKVAAQAAPVCPPAVLLDFARSSSTCFKLGRNQACYGNGSASITFQNAASTTPFTQPGAIVPLEQVRSITISPLDNRVSIASLAVQASLNDSEARSAAFLLFGDGSIENRVDYTPEISVKAKGTLNIRATPAVNGEIIKQLALNKGLIANGRTADRKWLRVHVPDSQRFGWVASEIVSSQQNLDTLSVVDASTPIYKPFEVMRLTTRDAALCDGSVRGGLLIQTPNVEQFVSMNINGVQVSLAGTAYLHTVDSGYLTINLLDGEADISRNNETHFVPAGARIRIPIDINSSEVNGESSTAEPYDNDSLIGLPLNNLPNRVKLANALTSEQITALLTKRQSEQATAATIATTEPPQACRYITAGTTTLWAGPGEFYEAINEIPAATRVFPVLRITDADGIVWWQLNNSNWLRARAVTQRGECADIPLTDFVPSPPYNTLSLETCQTQNGPLRVGQKVTIKFTPPAFENYYDASIALRVDPGQISIDERYKYVNASKPTSIGTAGTDQERYVRVFTTNWTATGGSHRIIGERLSYILTCNITVPFG